LPKKFVDELRLNLDKLNRDAPLQQEDHTAGAAARRALVADVLQKRGGSHNRSVQVVEESKKREEGVREFVKKKAYRVKAALEFISAEMGKSPDFGLDFGTGGVPSVDTKHGLKKKEYQKICKVLYQSNTGEQDSRKPQDTLKVNQRKARYLNGLISNDVSPLARITPRPPT
jgi:hypothetical protein